MGNLNVTITRDNWEWLRKKYEQKITEGVTGVKPTPSHLVNIAIKQLIANEEGREFTICYSKIRKTLIIK